MPRGVVHKVAEDLHQAPLVAAYPRRLQLGIDLQAGYRSQPLDLCVQDIFKVNILDI
jgi:hypothetical protein